MRHSVAWSQRLKIQMAISEAMKSFIASVDAIQSRFLKSVVAGQRDAMFNQKDAKGKREPEDASRQTHVEAQRETV